MSLILEALRKSEAERRRGQAPQLFDSPVIAPPAAPKRPLQAVWWAMPVVLSAALLVSWRYNATTESAADTAASGDAAGTGGVARAMPAAPPTAQPSPRAGTRAMGSVDAARSIAAPADPARRSAATSGSESGPAMPVSPEQPAAAPREHPAESAQVRPDAMPVGRETRPEDASTVLARQSSAAAPQPGSTPASAANASQPGIEPAPQLPAAAAGSTARAPSSTTAANPVRTIPGTKAEPLRLADLTPVERRSLPPLKMSMHMWSADTAQRFVILDGARVGEGDRVGEAVIDEITPDGAVLAWSGRRVKVPVH